jgi:muramoyltetrapeptide carboxypeptidase
MALPIRQSAPCIHPPRLKLGDKVRFVSPASTPQQESVFRRAERLEKWGLKVDFGEHAFREVGYLAGTDDERLADINTALCDDDVRAIFTTRGGKGSYRIAERLDFDGARRDPKFLIGFSDITILHLAQWKHCRISGVHGALIEVDGKFGLQNEESLRRLLMTEEPIVIRSRDAEITSTLTTSGVAEGVLLGGNLDMIATAAGWALPSLDGAILLLEAVNMYVGQVDRQLTMLRKAGHLDGLAGIAIGQFTGCQPTNAFTIVDLLREHLAPMRVPILGGLPLGHGEEPLSTLVGVTTTLDATAGYLTVRR